MTAIGRTTTFLCLLAGLSPGRAPAQGFEFGLGAHAARLTRETGVTTASANGAVFGVAGRLDVGPAALRIGYRQGSVSSDDGALDQDLVEGEVLAAVRPVEWASLAVGPHVRSLIQADGAGERWVMWEGRLDLRARLVGPVTGYLETWRVLGSSANVADEIGSAWGLDGGLRAPLPGTPLVVSLGYRSEHAQLGAGTRAETIEQIGMTIAYRRD